MGSKDALPLEDLWTIHHTCFPAGNRKTWKLSNKNISVGGGVEYLQVGSLKEDLLVWDLSTLEVRKIFEKCILG